MMEDATVDLQSSCRRPKSGKPSICTVSVVGCQNSSHQPSSFEGTEPVVMPNVMKPRTWLDSVPRPREGGTAAACPREANRGGLGHLDPTGPE